ncbi:iron chelate uptake ABC transporter family permease subunit [Saccharomonospora xinjiangensis]|uniref:ABC-type enterochelin transport system, permease component n=1 Tax=Saccharomonospora xinjiangensis XJ-54 TaxID=882086 RepID=I0V424_9PSEU|nr:iron chelate uptake ABC transporter family permease subunit [Saccharomonospora xinjiangensis]EID54877.1 ABC-type enterochelin transport system, permease component [Saccharomonospora xinjiangensis XJ-54]
MTTTSGTERIGRVTRVGRPAAELRRQRRVMGVLAAVTLAGAVAFCVVGLTGNIEYALGIRLRRVAAMVVVGVAVGYSSVLFQTVTNNRILTPQIMGFDSLFVLVQTLIVYFAGAIALSSADPHVLFAVQAGVMVAFAFALHRWLFDRNSRDLYLLVLVGVIFGTLFSSLSSLAARLINPNDFVTLQDSLFASFNSIDESLLWFSSVLLVVLCALGTRLFRKLDVVALGRDTAVGLGVNHRSVVNRALVLIAILVSVSTALVGPVAFLGVLVANLARQLTRSFRHAVVVPAASLLAVATLTLGQLVLEQVLGTDTALSVVVNFGGGLYFIALLVRESTR